MTHSPKRAYQPPKIRIRYTPYVYIEAGQRLMQQKIADQRQKESADAKK